jgi:hypothetical protein
MMCVRQGASWPSAGTTQQHHQAIIAAAHAERVQEDERKVMLSTSRLATHICAHLQAHGWIAVDARAVVQAHDVCRICIIYRLFLVEEGSLGCRDGTRLRGSVTGFVRHVQREPVGCINRRCDCSPARSQ